MSDIFENQSEVVENIRESAKKLGADLDKEPKQKPVPVAKSNCKLCWGKGWLVHSFPGNRGDEDVFNLYCRCVKFK